MALKMYMIAIPAMIMTVGELFLIFATTMIANIGMSENTNALKIRA